MRYDPYPPQPLLYRHTAAGAVIAIVSILAALTHGTLRYVLDWCLFVLLLIAIGVFFHGHRVIGNLWKDAKTKRQGFRSEQRSKSWHCSASNRGGKLKPVISIALEFPNDTSVWSSLFTSDDPTFTNATAVTEVHSLVFDGRGTEIGRCSNPQLLVGYGFYSVYPDDFGDSKPRLKGGRFRFDWIRLDSSEVLASQTFDIDGDGTLLLSYRQRFDARRIRAQKHWQHLKQPL